MVSVSPAIVQQIMPQLGFASIVRLVALDGHKPDRQVRMSGILCVGPRLAQCRGI